MSPLETTRLSLRKSSSLTPRRAKPTPSLRQPAIRSSSTTKESPAADGPSEEDELTAPEQLMQRKKRRTVSPPASDRSDDVLALVARKPRLAPAAESPLSSPSPSPPRASPRTETSREETSPASAESTRESPVPVIPPDPDPPPAPGGRSFRTRTIAQLKPFTTERTRYTRTLNKNGWEGAVVAPERGAVDETPEELKRRKEEQAKRPRNHLGGWLVSDEEEGDNATGSGAAQTGASRNEPTSVAEESLESEDGPTLLEREARRKERMEKAVSAAMGAAATRRECLLLFCAFATCAQLVSRTRRLLPSSPRSVSPGSRALSDPPSIPRGRQPGSSQQEALISRACDRQRDRPRGTSGPAAPTNARRERSSVRFSGHVAAEVTLSQANRCQAVWSWRDQTRRRSFSRVEVGAAHPRR